MSRKQPPKDISKFIQTLSQSLVNDIFTLLGAEEKKVGFDIASELYANFLANFVGVAVHKILTTDKQAGRKATFASVSKDFAEFKLRVQDSVAAGFQGAMSAYSGKTIEYYCTVRPVPPTPSQSSN